jgi:hypothetical protein
MREYATSRYTSFLRNCGIEVRPDEDWTLYRTVFEFPKSVIEITKAIPLFQFLPNRHEAA